MTAPEERVRLQVLLPLSQCALLLPKMLFPRIAPCLPELPFCFPELPFYFPEVSFCFLEVSFYFSKMPYCFRELPISFPEVSSFQLFLCASFSNAFFPADCTFTSSCSELLGEIIFASLLFCFLLEHFTDQLMKPS